MKKLGLLLLLIPMIAFATIYSYTAKDGKVYYTNERPTGLTTAERAQYKLVTVGTVDTMTKTEPLPLSNRNAVKAIQKKDNTPIPPPVSLMPTVNEALSPTPDLGVNGSFLMPATHDGVHNDALGAFRTGCAISHYTFDDPIVWPNVQGASHHHTFFGNASTDYRSTPDSILNTGNSTCDGGTLNRTGYWMPSIIDTATGAPLKPFRGIIYYKAGLVPGKFIQPFPKHLRMIAGDANVKTITQVTRQPPHENGIEPTKFVCINESANSYTGEGKLIPACKKATVGRANNGYVRVSVNFPQCWDGKNLDSPDHKSHMAYSHWQQIDASGKKYYPENRCPTTHPIPLPQVTEIFDFEVTDAVNGTDKWRLASDNYELTTRGGLSMHADWMNGWDETIMSRIVKNCLNKNIDCGVGYLGDGEALMPYDLIKKHLGIK